MISFKNDRTGIDYAASFTGLKGRVPCSQQVHSYQLNRGDVLPQFLRRTQIDRTMIPRDPENFRTVDVSSERIVAPDGSVFLAPGGGLPSGYVWRGHIVNGLPERLWVHIRAAVSSVDVRAEIEAEVDADGSFRMYRPCLPGPNVLYVMNEQGRVRYLSVLQCEITLEPKLLQIVMFPEPAPIILR
ncbi:MAG: hypothetical protein K2X03_15770 [Bryobacteraceae bacterium]|nr:hypothetical protein [Bryobacteraceae bacterium]